MPLEKIAQQLNVNYLVEGNFQISGNKVKVNMQLIDPSNLYKSSVSQYFGEWNEDELFSVQAKIAEGVIELLNLQITDSEIQEVSRIPTSNNESYDYFLQGQYQFMRFSKEGIENARVLFSKAIELDSSFIEPYIGLADIWIMSGAMWGVNKEKVAWTNAKTIFAKALDKDVNKIYHKTIIGTRLRGQFYYSWDFQNIEKYFQKYHQGGVIELKSMVIGFDYARKTGRFIEALNFTEIALKKDPTIGSYYAHKAFMFYFLGRSQEAKNILNSSDQLFNTDFFYLIESTQIYYYLGDFNMFSRQLDKLLKIFPDRPPLIKWLSLIRSVTNDNSAGNEKYLNLLLQDYQNENSGSPAWFLALYYAHIGDDDKTFEWLQKSYEAHEVEMTWLKEEPLLRPLRSDPRYIDLYDKVGFPFPISPTTEFKP
ncbi:MAG: hypothetical protein ABF293_07905 [Flavobacteriaceae bacterium]